MHRHRRRPSVLYAVVDVCLAPIHRIIFITAAHREHYRWFRHLRTSLTQFVDILLQRDENANYTQYRPWTRGASRKTHSRFLCDDTYIFIAAPDVQILVIEIVSVVVLLSRSFAVVMRQGSRINAMITWRNRLLGFSSVWRSGGNFNRRN